VASPNRDGWKSKFLTVTDFGGQLDADMTRQNGHDLRPRATEGGGSWPEEEDYLRIIHDPKAFRRTLDDCFRQTPELFPVNFALGYELKDDRMSAKQQIPIRRILLKDDSAYSIRPSFLMPYMTAHTANVEGPLFLRKFGVPFWALARVFGGDPMSWYRMECGLGRFSVVGTTVRTATLPEHLLADEHHQGLDGQKVYIGHDRRQRVLPGSGTGRGGRERQVEGRLPSLQRRGL
jgi:hypothetical protein